MTTTVVIKRILSFQQNSKIYILLIRQTNFKINFIGFICS